MSIPSFKHHTTIVFIWMQTCVYLSFSTTQPWLAFRKMCFIVKYSVFSKYSIHNVWSLVARRRTVFRKNYETLFLFHFVAKFACKLCLYSINISLKQDIVLPKRCMWRPWEFRFLRISSQKMLFYVCMLYSLNFQFSRVHEKCTQVEQPTFLYI